MEDAWVCYGRAVKTRLIAGGMVSPAPVGGRSGALFPAISPPEEMAR